ncbi:DUF1801 domain-containing protein [Microbacterium sp. zg-YB36]|uniref:DUF1801 domain-containing protein n=1 Tax=Microbacterium sp. zg-YB36 TaxID=2969407 RepID=UPI00214C1468|nr:DUF1801 domain-containing protein [Microbacterium sp. zg-YB36]MDL5351691.1 DUF1801 domain-containing protein [Microbacterium sp. zg-YB36]
MAPYENKTKATDVSAEEFIANVEHPVRRADAETLDLMYRRITGQGPVMWGPTMVGYGHHHFEYDSGHSGDAFAAGFSPRKASLTIYGAHLQPEAPALLERLGKHRLGKSCLYVNTLADVDLAVLEELIATGYRYVTEDLNQAQT